MPEPEGPQDADSLNAGAPPGGAGGEGGSKAGKSASPGAVERLKARAARDSRRRGGLSGRDASAGGGDPSRKGRGPRRRLSDEERQARWQKAVAKKARKIKQLTDVLILICLACILGAHALPFAHKRVDKGGIIVEYGPRRGYEVMLDLVKIDLERSSPDSPFVSPGTKPLWVLEGGQTRDLQPAFPADLMSMLIVVVPVGAALLLLLYLLDFLVWMGRPLPLVSLLYGFGSVAYLMVTKVSEAGPWNIIGIGGYAAMTAWFMLLVPLFLLGAFSMLRFFFSARRKRYAYAGLDAPSAPRPPEPPEDEEPGAVEVSAEPDAGAGADMTKTPVSSPAISFDPPDGAGPDADANEGPATSPFD